MLNHRRLFYRHRVKRVDVHLNDRFGNPVVPQEWFFVPLFIIDEVL